jgi:hypothetical protein
MIFQNSHAKPQRCEDPCERPPKKNFAALRLCVIFSLLSFSTVTAQVNGLSDAEIKGRELAQQLREARPDGNLTNAGVMQIRDGSGNRTNLNFYSEIFVAESNWWTSYRVALNPGTNFDNFVTTKIIHSFGQPNTYYLHEGFCGQAFTDKNAAIPFAHSDFWLCDLGLEFFHWPAQKVLPKTTTLKRSREYTLLESTNPNPPTNGYSRVLSWIDKESGGILQAEAYDAQGKLLKVFEPKSFKKVNGQWELQEMEIRNVQTGSRTRLEFDLTK